MTVPVRSRLFAAVGLLPALMYTPALEAADRPAPARGDRGPQAAPREKAAKNWLSLFDGKSLEGWKITKFGGEGDVEVKEGRIVLGAGSDMTGIHTDRKLPRIDYEVTLEAMRVAGSDFFCGLTFPVGKRPCSLILGGWGGAVCGLSSIDGFDASENETTTLNTFKSGTWYRVRLRVTEKKIQAWLDGKEIVDQKIEGRKVSIRPEVELSQPFGLATWQTTGAVRDIRIRRLDGRKIE